MGIFYNRQAFDASVGANSIGSLLFYFPYQLAKKKQARRVEECDDLARKKAFMTLLQKPANFKLELKEIVKIELRTKNIWNQFWSNHNRVIRVYMANGKYYRFEIPFGETVENIVLQLESAGVKISNKIEE
ncbi:hypothetical protein PWEIH_03826 [Listeria weihenstephanensis FSL R9-0317]|uniref:Uncharacterized protein n=1 Tax=Listeria weihenstephanensis TaxID=1006155 RepID=A0A1S7FS13_9LIST|nr:hypothetical protein [Listeria weihenstephanensis]AQY50231.1 hypothetical protein UE46_03715 [Listeria weihenstephanensis]EUJ40522.1 hypothetical protein PWEIH_03826 [Listeria weihenstephanensis FSL R9-0317]